jgi:predicted Zn-dependent peptidase
MWSRLFDISEEKEQYFTHAVCFRWKLKDGYFRNFAGTSELALEKTQKKPEFL